ncbi:extracellular solute-binding protein [Leucobacter sp. W1153]|uniref:extracellular solute-binding protein n=1 Tax=Leucobacter sp. W1153 TaxID=3439064 RepID=UPI003F3FEDFA
MTSSTEHARFRGLTWDHPRGAHALRAAAEQAERLGASVLLSWDAQPLEGFESAPIGELAARYDLIVIDHPHLGDAIAQGALQPLDAVLPAELLADLAVHSVGPSFASYSAESHLWALPLDAATQVAAVREDLVDRTPATWDEVRELSLRAPVALSLAGPHAFLSLCSVAVSLGAEPRSLAPRPDFVADPAPLFDRETALAALAMLHELAERAPLDTAALNPIGLLDRMRTRNEIAYIPLVYGYVNYSAASTVADPGSRVHFVDAPAAVRGGRPGSTIGGTGIAISADTRVTPELAAHLGWLLSAAAQEGFIPQHDGQPSRISAWESDAVNATSADFYRRTRRTLDASWIRPRFAGYTAFQSEASAIVRDGLGRPFFDPVATLERIEAAYLTALTSAAHHTQTGATP